ncbi:MAG TPA: HdeD family acid-resistance protein [Acidiferrobacterales bacterium]|nr:HdeD family acid-resistance protein [Acidiferrobacterales bacterium]
MNDQSTTKNTLSDTDYEDFGSTKYYSGSIIGLGIFLLLLGVLAVSASFIATLATVVVFGILLLAGSAVQFMNASLGKGRSNFILQLAAGIFYLVAGLLMIISPVEAALGLTLMLIALFFVSGLLRMITAVRERFSGWGWMFFLGVINLVMGGLLWYGWPWSGLWFIGFLVGVEMIFGGVFWLTLGSALRRLPDKFHEPLGKAG